MSKTYFDIELIKARLNDYDVPSLLAHANIILEKIKKVKKEYESILNALLKILKSKLKNNTSNYIDDIKKLDEEISKVTSHDFLKINKYTLTEMYLNQIDTFEMESNNNDNQISDDNINQKKDNNINNDGDIDLDNYSDKATTDESIEELFYPNIDNEKKNKSGFSESNIENVSSSYNSSQSDIRNIPENINTNSNSYSISNNREYKDKNNTISFSSISEINSKGSEELSSNSYYKDYIEGLICSINYFVIKLEHLMKAGVKLLIEPKIDKESCNYKDILNFLDEIQSAYDGSIKVVTPELSHPIKKFRDELNKGIIKQSGTIQEENQLISNNTALDELNILSFFKESVFKKLSFDIFDYKFDVIPSFNYDEQKIKEGELYYHPYKFFGIGLKHEISKCDKWPYAYRPIKSNTDLVSLLIQKDWKIFQLNNIRDKKQKEKIGKGICLTPDISLAEENTATIEVLQKKYTILLMVRVNQRKIKERQKIKNGGQIWIVEKDYIKICRILFRESVEDKDKNVK